MLHFEIQSQPNTVKHIEMTSATSYQTLSNTVSLINSTHDDTQTPKADKEETVRN